VHVAAALEELRDQDAADETAAADYEDAVCLCHVVFSFTVADVLLRALDT
jgi:hypothetical protein